MNLKVLIEFEGAADEVSAWLSSRFGPEPPGSTSGQSPSPWTSEVADQVVARITRDARRALRYLVVHAPTVSFEQLQSHMKMDGIHIGGVMASFGFAENAGLPRPYQQNRRKRQYLIDPATAAVVRAALDRHEAKYGKAA